MKRQAPAVALALVLAACGAQPIASPSPSDDPDAEALQGGTLRIALLPPAIFRLDPQRAGFIEELEIHRCCLSRTLLSYNGRSTEEGGTELLPDLAATPPEVSADGLTWTFRLKPDIRYAPPLEETAVKASDVIRGIQRYLTPDVLVDQFNPFTAIEGTEAYAAGEAGTISGLEAPDDLTLVVRLNEPNPDLGYAFATGATVPIPPLPDDPGARLGVAEGHDADLAPFLVATGPYMIEGSEALDFSTSPEQRARVAGYRAPEYSEAGDMLSAGLLTLVRNPSWDAESDALRAAYADRIELIIDGRDRLDEYAAQVDEAKIDLVVVAGRAPQAPPEQVDRYQADPDLRDRRLFINERDFVRTINMNVAVPPLDDVYVRRAISFAVDKAAMRDLQAGPAAGEIAGHLMPNSLEANLLRDYDAYPTPGGGGDEELAKEQMRKSAYDRDGDGVCDDPACQDLRAIHLENPLLAEKSALVAENLQSIGIELRVEALTNEEFVEETSGPLTRIPLMILAWGLETASAGADLFGSNTIESGFNLTLVGASPEELQEWGYEVTDVPSVDDRIDACRAEVEPARTRCFADLDQYLMEEVVPWVPYLFENHIQPVSRRVVAYSFDQSVALPAFDRIAVSDAGDRGEGD